MSHAIKQMTGLDVPEAVAMQVLDAFVKACRTPKPLQLFALVVSPETAYLATRAEVAQQFHNVDLHTVALAIVRRRTRPGELLICAIGDDLPRLISIPFGPVRTALAATERSSA